MHPTRIFKHPDELAKAWGEYKESINQQAFEWTKVDYVGKNGNRVEEPTKVPYTLEGFERFCYEKYGCVEQYFKNQDGYYEDFIPICSRVKKEIRENQIVGGMLGFFNPSITQRLNGLSEKQQVETKVVDKFDFDN
jgi:hypothetical protein